MRDLFIPLLKLHAGEIQAWMAKWRWKVKLSKLLRKAGILTSKRKPFTTSSCTKKKEDRRKERKKNVFNVKLKELAKRKIHNFCYIPTNESERYFFIVAQHLYRTSAIIMKNYIVFSLLSTFRTRSPQASSLCVITFFLISSKVRHHQREFSWIWICLVLKKDKMNRVEVLLFSIISIGAQLNERLYGCSYEGMDRALYQF